MSYINSTTLSQIFNKDKRKGQGLFPLLIKKLIISSCNVKGNIRFPSGDAIWSPGFDGIVTNITVSTSIVPLGDSVWELGTNEDSVEKINQDYSKRTDEPSEYDKKDYSFVLVVPKLWAYSVSILDWEAEKRKDKVWKDVKIIDAEQIADWISENVEVGNWFLTEMECKSPINIDILATKWNKVTTITEPKFNCELMLNSNKNNVESFIIDIKDTGKNSIVIRSHYGREHALYFALGALYSVDDIALKEKVIFANNEESLKYIIENCKNKIVITEYYHNILLGNENKYVILLSESENFLKANIELNYSTLRNFSDALESMGVNTSESFSLAKKVNNNISILKRRLAKEPLIKKPVWANDKNKDSIIPLLLVSEFSEKEEADKLVIEYITNTSFEDYLISLNQWIGYDDSPVFKYDRIYRINSKEECFSVVNISSTYLNRLKELLKTIFLCENEKYNLDADEWGLAGIYGKRPKYHGYIIKGIIDSLIILAINSERVQQECDVLVSEILSSIKSSENLTLNCSDYFSKLAELSPSAYMNFLETEIDKRSSTILTLVEKTNKDLIGYTHSRLTQVSWGLDLCLRLDEYGLQALRIYLKLCFGNFNVPKSFDIMEKVAIYFQPISSGFVSISMQDRNQLLFGFLETIKDKKTELIVKFLEKFLFGLRHTFTLPSGPVWRIYDSDNTIKCTYGDYDNCIHNALVWLLDNTETYSDWLGEAFKGMQYMSAQTINEFFTKATSTIKNFNDEEKAKIYSIIVKQLYNIKYYDDFKGRKYRKAFIDKFELLLESSTPKDLFLKYRYMFLESLHSFPLRDPIPYSKEDRANMFTENYERAEQEIRDAVAELIEYYGQDAMNAIVEVVAESCEISKILIDCFEHQKLLNALFKLGKMQVLANCFRIIDPDEVVGFVEQLKGNEKQLYSILPFTEFFTDYVNGKEAEQEFWADKSIFLRDANREFFEKVYEKLLKFKPANLINYFSYYDTPFNVQKAKEVILAVTANHDGVGGRFYELKHLLNKIDSCIFDEEVVTCEFMMLPLFAHEDLPLGIKKFFWNQPNILVDLIKEIHNENFKNESLKFLLIMPIGQCLIPIEYIKYKPEKLQEWANTILSASETLSENERSLAIRTVVRTISFENEVEGQIWPSEHVSKILELITDKKMLEDFVTTIINAQGARFVGDGSDQYKIMEKYLAYAEHYKLKPSTHYVLKQLAEQYKREGDNDRMHSIIEE